MNYELAKQLKDAGFPQNMIFGIWLDAEKPIPIEECPKTFGDTVACPILSELIEACGRWITLRQNPGGIDWFASIIRFDEDEEVKEVVQIGSTPEEAVANLWIDLHKKHIPFENIDLLPTNQPK